MTWNNFYGTHLKEKLNLITSGQKIIVKPTKEGSSLGVSIVENKPDLIKMALKKLQNMEVYD